MTVSDAGRGIRSGPDTPASREALIEVLGCYILEVGFRQHGGRFSWYEERKQPVLVVGKPEFTLP